MTLPRNSGHPERLGKIDKQEGEFNGKDEGTRIVQSDV